MKYYLLLRGGIVCTGLRKGEVVNIKWDDIDFRNRIIYIGNTKNGEKREIPINDYLTEQLKSIKRRSIGTWPSLV